ncbi:MAG: GTPase HflX [Anaerolineae bacterium]|nr:GTPase HflX [Anaerolineae bacterium]
MHENNLTTPLPERAFLVGIAEKGSHPLLSIEESLQELALLARTAGMDVVGQTYQNVSRIDPATLIGKGKVEEVQEMLVASDAQAVVFDEELNPRHQRELEQRFGEGIKVLDRSAVILDIFAQHASTREGALQVELAQYEYRLPRLTRAWTHLSRQTGGGGGRSGTGGVGLRGPGETQLEVDRRDIIRRISKLKDELEHVREHRAQHRRQRERAGIPLVALVGYTNAGKSSLLHAISGADVYIADQLFATLDPTTRRISLPSGRQTLLTDTVGFIQKLPTTLVAAFRATLEEIAEADLILNVVDVTHPNVEQHIETVEDTLAEIEVPPIPRVLVWNKIDLLDDAARLAALQESQSTNTHAAQVAVSARTHEGLPDLLAAIERILSETQHSVRLLLPYERGDLVALLHEQATVEHQEHGADGVILVARIPPWLVARFEPFQLA